MVVQNLAGINAIVLITRVSIFSTIGFQMPFTPPIWGFWGWKWQKTETFSSFIPAGMQHPRTDALRIKQRKNRLHEQNLGSQKIKNHVRVMFHPFAQMPPQGKSLSFLVCVWWYCRCNHPRHILRQSVQWFLNSDTPSFPILHRLSWLHLWQCRHYHAMLWKDRFLDSQQS